MKYETSRRIKRKVGKVRRVKAVSDTDKELKELVKVLETDFCPKCGAGI